MGLAHFKILIFSDFSSMGVGLENDSYNFCHPLQVANLSLLLVQNSLHYVNFMNFESTLGVFLFKTGMFQRIEN